MSGRAGSASRRERSRSAGDSAPLKGVWLMVVPSLRRAPGEGTRPPPLTFRAGNLARVRGGTGETAGTSAAAAATSTRARETVRVWKPDGPLDVAMTFGFLRRGPLDPSYRRTPDGALWRVSRTPAGVGTLRLRTRPAEGAVEATAWGAGAPWLL